MNGVRQVVDSQESADSSGRFDVFSHIDEQMLTRLIVIIGIVGVLAVIYVAGALITFLALRATEHLDELGAIIATVVIAPFAALFFVGIGPFAVKVYLHHKNHGVKQ